MHVLKLRKVGNALGVTLPKEAVNQLRVAEGETLYLTPLPDGGFRITPYDPDFARFMESAENGMRKYRNSLRELAK